MLGLLVCPLISRAAEGLLAPTNLVAWCIVPFDTKKRGPEERAEMLERLGSQLGGCTGYFSKNGPITPLRNQRSPHGPISNSSSPRAVNRGVGRVGRTGSFGVFLQAQAELIIGGCGQWGVPKW